VNCRDATGRRGRRAGSVELDAVLFGLSTFGQLMECRTGSGAGIDRAGSGREIEEPAQS
jgi:hypothetical protein